MTDAAERMLLEVWVLHASDALAAAEGGADRLLLLGDPEGATVPQAAAVSAVVRATDLPVRVLLREYAGTDALPYDRMRLAGLGRDFLDLGAEGLSFGFLDRDLEIDVAACSDLVAQLGAPWTFSSDFDAALDADRAWRAVSDLPHLDAVTSAGSSRGLAEGGESLIARAAASSSVAGLALAAGGLGPEQVPWLVRAGVRQIGIGAEARPDRSWTKGYVDPAIVRTWRMLLDDALGRALGRPL